LDMALKRLHSEGVPVIDLTRPIPSGSTAVWSEWLNCDG
jgi:hypothetical protein